MGNRNSDRIIVLVLVVVVFIFPFTLFAIFFNVIYLIIFIFPISTIIHLYISYNKEKKNKNSKKKNYLNFRLNQKIGFPFIMLGFVILPLVFSISIAF
jgi:hypothetical protein